MGRVAVGRHVALSFSLALRRSSRGDPQSGFGSVSVRRVGRGVSPECREGESTGSARSSCLFCGSLILKDKERI